MREFDHETLHRLCSAIASASVNDVTHAIIFYERQEPTIDACVREWVEKAKTRCFFLYRKTPEWVDVIVETAIQRRRERLGDGLWFSKT